MENRMAISLPIHIQNQVVRYVSYHYRFNIDIFKGIALVCWRWLHYVSGLVDTTLVFKPMATSSYSLKDLYQRTTSRYCIFKGVKGIKHVVPKGLDPFRTTNQYHTKEMMENHEWIRSFYGSLKSLDIDTGDHYCRSFYYLQELFDGVLFSTERYYKEKEKEKKNDKECINGDGDVEEDEDRHKIVELKDLILRAFPYRLSQMTKLMKLILPYCQHVTELYIYLYLDEIDDDTQFICHFLQQLHSLRNVEINLNIDHEKVVLCNKVNEIFESLSDTVESLIIIMFPDGHGIPFKVLPKFPNLKRLGIYEVKIEYLKEYTDFILNNNTITHIIYPIEYTQDTSPIFQHKVNMVEFNITFSLGNHFSESLSQMEYPDIQFHPYITTLYLKFHTYSANIVRSIVKQCPKLIDLEISSVLIGGDILSSLTEIVKLSPSLNTLDLNTDKDTNGKKISVDGKQFETQQFIDLLNAVSQSKTMDTLCCMFLTFGNVEYPQPEPIYEGWNITIAGDLLIIMSKNKSNQ